MYLGVKSHNNTDIVGYADANWTNEQDGKSRSGVLFKLYGNTIYWRSNKQETISLSSAEAELVALTDAAKEARYLDMLLNQEIGIGIQLPITIHEDNEACIAIANDPKHQHRTKHIRLKNLAIRNWIPEGTIKTASIKSKDMIADTLTKVLPRSIFSELKEKMKVIPSQQLTIVEGNRNKKERNKLHSKPQIRQHIIHRFSFLTTLTSYFFKLIFISSSNIIDYLKISTTFSSIASLPKWKDVSLYA